MNDIAIVRTDRFGPQVRQLVAMLETWFGDRIVLAFANPDGPIDADGRAALQIDDAMIEDLGLMAVPDWRWRCGDYVQIAMMQAYPEADHYWMIESDVHFNVPEISAVFAPFRDNPADLLSYGFGPRTESWGHYDSVSPFYANPHGCFYPMTRMSRRAIAHVQAARISYAEAWSQIAEDDRPGYANDESLVCSALVADGSFDCQRLELGAPGMFLPQTFTTEKLMLLSDVDKLPQGVLHSVVNQKEFPVRIRRKMNLPAIQHLPYYSELIAGQENMRLKRFFTERSAFLLRSFHKPGRDRMLLNLPWVEPVGARRAFVHEHRKPGKWVRSSARDFSFHPVSYQAPINTKKVLPYAVNYQLLELMLVDTTMRQVAEDPFLFLSQYENADYGVFAPVSTLPEALDVEQSHRVTFVFSIGRCGSTLTSNMAKAAGLTSYSECDALLGLPQFRAGQDRPNVERLLRSTVGAMLDFQDGDHIVIKMKSQSNNDIKWFTKVFPQARFVFLTREMTAWAKSFVQVFDWSPQQLFSTLRQSVRAVKHLAEQGQLTTFMRYEDLAEAPEAALPALFGPDVAIPAEHLAAEMARESQSGLLTHKVNDPDEVAARITALRGLIAESEMAEAFAESPVIIDGEAQPD